MRNFIQATRGIVLAAGLLLAGTVAAADRVAIPFADLGNIRDWHADNNEELFV